MNCLLWLMLLNLGLSYVRDNLVKVMKCGLLTRQSGCRRSSSIRCS